MPNLGDVTALDWARVPPVDLVSAGWPCQDISYAGPGPASRKGPAVDCGCTSPTAFAAFDPATSTWRTSPRSARAASRKSSATWPRSGMTRSGRACALPTPEPRTAATASWSLPSGQGRPGGSRLLPIPVAGNFNDGASLPTWQGRRDRQTKLGRNGNGIGTPLPVAIALLPTPMAGDFGADKASGPVRPSGAKRQTGLPDVIIHRIASQGCPAGTAEPGAGRLLPTPDAGCSPNGHGRRGGRPGNGHQSGHGLDGSAAGDRHSPGGMVFAVQTIDGGALAFYSLTAAVTLTPPPGQALAIGIAGYYTPARPQTSTVTIRYVEQFAAYLPPGHARAQLLADASGIAG